MISFKLISRLVLLASLLAGSATVGTHHCLGICSAEAESHSEARKAKVTSQAKLPALCNIAHSILAESIMLCISKYDIVLHQV